MSIPDLFPFPANYPPRLQRVVDSGEIYGTDRLAFIRQVSDIMVGFNPNPSPSEYERVARAVVERHHCLADTIKGQPACVSETILCTLCVVFAELHFLYI